MLAVIVVLTNLALGFFLFLKAEYLQSAVILTLTMCLAHAEMTSYLANDAIKSLINQGKITVAALPDYWRDQ